MKAEESSEETTRISEVIELRVTQVTVMLLDWKGQGGSAKLRAGNELSQLRIVTKTVWSKENNRCTNTRVRNNGRSASEVKKNAKVRRFSAYLLVDLQYLIKTTLSFNVKSRWGIVQIGSLLQVSM